MTIYALLAVGLGIAIMVVHCRRARRRRGREKQHLGNVLGPAREPPEGSPAFEFLIESHRRDPITTRTDGLQRLEDYRRGFTR